MPRYGQRSEPQTHVTEIRMMASVGFSIRGSSRSSKRTSRGPYKTVPCMLFILLPCNLEYAGRFAPFGCHSTERRTSSRKSQSSNSTRQAAESEHADQFLLQKYPMRHAGRFPDPANLLPNPV